MSEILPCPVCGSGRFATITAWVEEPGFGYTVNCNACGWNDSRGCGASGGWGETPEEAIAIWNRRATPVPPSLPTPAATPTDSANPPPVESVGPNSEAQP